MQTCRRENSGDWLELPLPETEVIPGVRWGRLDCLFTPAYWAAQAWHHESALNNAPLKLGHSLAEEVAACLLGGHGMPSEIGIAAFQKVKQAGILTQKKFSSQDVESILSQPLLVKGRLVRYRFWKQRSRYLSNALTALNDSKFEVHPHSSFRDMLTTLDGIGPKTASWITRNWLDSDDVAILDIHVLRAGRIMGLFDRCTIDVTSYRAFERRFVEFARAISVRTSRLDALIWHQMKLAGPIARRYISN